MSNQTPINEVLIKTKNNWPESDRNISPEILRMHRVTSYLHHNLEEVLDHYLIQPADFSVLETLRKEPIPHCLTPTELSTAMLFSSGGLTKVLNRITIAGYILRIDNPNDKRGKLVQLTESGKSLIDNIIVELHKTEQNKMDVLSKDEKEKLNSLLAKILNVWEPQN